MQRGQLSGYAVYACDMCSWKRLRYGVGERGISDAVLSVDSIESRGDMSAMTKNMVKTEDGEEEAGNIYLIPRIEWAERWSLELPNR